MGLFSKPLAIIDENGNWIKDEDPASELQLTMLVDNDDQSHSKNQILPKLVLPENRNFTAEYLEDGRIYKIVTYPIGGVFFGDDSG